MRGNLVHLGTSDFAHGTTVGLSLPEKKDLGFTPSLRGIEPHSLVSLDLDFPPVVIEAAGATTWGSNEQY